MPQRAGFYPQIRGTLLHYDSIYFASESTKISIASTLPKVGYSTKAVGDPAKDSTFSILVAPFRHVDGGETKLTLNELKVNQVYDWGSSLCTGFQPVYDTLQMFSADGQPTNVVTYVCKDALENMFYNYDAEPGWYDAVAAGGWNFSQPLGESSVSFGEGYIVKAGAGAGIAPQVTFSGEVKQDVTEIPCPGFTFAGNNTPVGFYVKDITVNQTYDWGSSLCTGFQPVYDTIQIFGVDGQPKEVLTYVCKDALENMFYNYDAEPGWYDAIEAGGWNFSNPKGMIPLASGEAFIVKSGEGAGILPTITIPNPMTIGK